MVYRPLEDSKPLQLIATPLYAKNLSYNPATYELGWKLDITLMNDWILYRTAPLRMNQSEAYQSHSPSLHENTGYCRALLSELQPIIDSETMDQES